MGEFPLTQGNVATSLAVELISDFPKSLYGFGAGHDRQFHFNATSTISSSIPGGMGSPCALKLSR